MSRAKGWALQMGGTARKVRGLSTIRKSRPTSATLESYILQIFLWFHCPITQIDGPVDCRWDQQLASFLGTNDLVWPLSQRYCKYFYGFTLL